MSVRPLFKGFALTFILYNCRKRDYIITLYKNKSSQEMQQKNSFNMSSFDNQIFFLIVEKVNN